MRDRESFVQVTNVDSIDGTVHVQIFDVSNNCNENNFFDTYTPNDTHVYNMRDIQTNNGNPSGVLLPQGAYGFVSVITVDPNTGNFADTFHMIGKFRIIDETGYEYRTNSVNTEGTDECCWNNGDINLTFNFNTKGNITLSDAVDIDILNENEVIFSCRNVIFACTDQDNPLLEELLETVGDASVASFEYGINNAIPHSRGGKLLCPGNIISDGFVTISPFNTATNNFIGFIGLNNGNGRGSMDSFWYLNDDVFQR